MKAKLGMKSLYFIVTKIAMSLLEIVPSLFSTLSICCLLNDTK